MTEQADARLLQTDWKPESRLPEGQAGVRHTLNDVWTRCGISGPVCARRHPGTRWGGLPPSLYIWMQCRGAVQPETDPQGPRHGEIMSHTKPSLHRGMMRGARPSTRSSGYVRLSAVASMLLASVALAQPTGLPEFELERLELNPNG